AEVQERIHIELVPEHMPAVGLAVEPSGRHPGVQIGDVSRADLQDVRGVEPQEQLNARLSRQAKIARPPQFGPSSLMARERQSEISVAGHRAPGCAERL